METHNYPEIKVVEGKLTFNPVTEESMQIIWPYLLRETGRTTDFSYGGLLMWADYFDYEYAIYKNTLFIKGKAEGNITETAFSIPVGDLPLKDAVEVLKEYCDDRNMPLLFSAVPEYAVENFKKLNPGSIVELPDWADYLYSAKDLATLSGKKFGKKRNHVNQFTSMYPNWELVEMTRENAEEAMEFMNLFDKEGDDTEMAIEERYLSRLLIRMMEEGESNMFGALLKADGKICAYTIADIKGDTLFIHVEKALREFPGSYEMINKAFAEHMLAAHPEIEYINREDDAGDMGLRMAKESYRPIEKLKKYNISF